MDRLFAERAEQYEVKPDAAAWDAIQSQMGTKSNGLVMVWKVAAVLVVLISSVLVIFNWDNPTSETLAGETDHPQLMERKLAWNLPVDVVKKQLDVAETVAETVIVPVEEFRESAQILAVTQVNRPYLELTSITLTWEIDIPSKPALFNDITPETSVKIRYYASTPESEKTKKSFGQFIARAQQKLSPDELLADIRTAKDDLFRGNKGD